MSKKGFTHLHLHSHYSLLDGAISFDKLLARCKELKMESVAVTDHGNMFGAIEFYTKAQSAKIKPIIGIEAYVAPGRRFDKQKTSIGEAAYHIILLAENNTGYQNLLKLASAGYTEGFYYRPRIDKEILAELSVGLICTSACLKGEIAVALVQNDEPRAIAAAESYLKIFGPERFFIELQRHQDSEAPQITDKLIELAGKLGVGMVATNDVHFLNAGDHEAHDCLCCISTGKTIQDPKRMLYPPDIYLKSPEQMRELFADVPEACDNTLAIAERCDVRLDLKKRHAPKYRPADESTPEEYLTRLVYDGAKQRYGSLSEEVKSRLERELDVIESKGFASYFLIVWDFCDYARRNNILCGARGSAVGTLVGHCLGLCDVDPLRYDLLFERFMDPQRNEMPDIDIDICQDGRGKVIDYVRQKYGQVAQIITFGTMKARAVIRDVCRVLDVPLSEADRLAKLVPTTLGITLDNALRSEPELRRAYERDEQTRKVIEIGKKLEGLARHASVHAAGVVVADQPLTDFAPLYKAPGSDDLITQFDGPTVEKVGLLKMDFLGLQTLSVIERTCRLVETIHNEKIELEKIEFNDPKVFEVFATGRTKGIFQFESGGMQDLLMKLRPDRIEDLIAANALFRPGPMILIGDYIERKHGSRWDVPHEIMKEILEETYGIMVYQEQVMRICNRLGDIPLREAYTLIKAISKKKGRVIARQREEFVGAATKKGLSKGEAQRIFELIERFAGYGFNKSHSTRYAIIAYHTAYLKAYWPVEYMAALLTYERDSTDKVVEYIGECKEMGIEVAPPDINESFTDFTVLYEKKHPSRLSVSRFREKKSQKDEQLIGARTTEGQKDGPIPGKLESIVAETGAEGSADGHLIGSLATKGWEDESLSKTKVPVSGGKGKAGELPPKVRAERAMIRFGLAAVKGVGQKAVEEIIAARERIGKFKSLFHFCENVDLRVVNKQVIESLIKAGALDKLGGSRAQMMAGLEKALQIGSETQADAQMGQMSFFAGPGAEQDFDKDHERLPNMPAWPEMQMLTYEKQVLGFYVTSNPLSKHAETISFYSTVDSSRLIDCAEGQEVVMGGMVAKIRYRLTKNGRNAGSKMAVFVLEDLQGSAEVVLFPEALERNGKLLALDKIVFVRGRVDCRRQVPNIVAEELIELDSASERIGAKVNIKLDVKDITKERVARIKTICSTHKGRSPVYVTVTSNKGRVSAVASRNLSVQPSAEFCRQMEQVVGADNFELTK